MTAEPIIRPIRAEDLDGIMEVEHKSFSLPWSRGMFEEELTNPNALYLILEISEKICGYAGLWKILDEGHITNVAVHPGYRRMGYGRLMLKSLIECAAACKINALTLEVRAGNTAAISLYESFGFRSSGRRKRYYSDNKEDALIMWLFFPRAE